MNQMICDEAEGCRRFVGEFPWSMSDFKPGEQGMSAQSCSRNDTTLSYGGSAYAISVCCVESCG